MKKIRSSQPVIPVLNWMKHQSFPVIIVKIKQWMANAVQTPGKKLIMLSQNTLLLRVKTNQENSPPKRKCLV